MKNNKERLAFEMLEKEMEVIVAEQKSRIVGGKETGTIIWGKDPDGNLYYKFSDSEDWISYNMLQEVIIVGTGNGSSIKTSDYWSNMLFYNWATSTYSGSGTLSSGSSGGNTGSDTYTTEYSATSNSYSVDVNFTNAGS